MWINNKILTGLLTGCRCVRVDFKLLFVFKSLKLWYTMLKIGRELGR